MRKSPLALLLSLICLISSHNEIQAQGHPPTDSLRQRAAASVGKEKHDLLMRIAMSTNDIADWDATLNDAIDRYDTPAICQSRLNRIQCLFNFYSVDSAIIEAQESLPFILDAKQYSFYFSTYNTYTHAQVLLPRRQRLGFGFVVRFVVETRVGRIDHPEP